MVRRYERLRHLSVGRFGVSLLIKDVESDTLAMMKTIDVAALNGAERSELLRELRGLTKLRHPYLLPMRESFLHQGRLCLVMDYLPRGSLSAEVDAARSFGTQIGPEKVLHSFVQALLGLSYLHSCGTLHRDLRTKRLLRTQSGLVVLTGTALSVVVRRALFFERPNLDALRYRSPELLMEPEAHTAASDMWAMGIILYELMALRTPWEDEHAVRLLEKIRNQSLRPPPKQYSEELAPMCHKMLKREPQSRATAEELLQTPFVQARIVSLLDAELDDAAAGGAVPAQALCWNSAEDSGPRRDSMVWSRGLGLWCSCGQYQLLCNLHEALQNPVLGH
ncbi:NEK1 [Symbiodinium microadriaticum]|nr:NEK1 [Symbiodinium microadriaticum]